MKHIALISVVTQYEKLLQFNLLWVNG